ncbi:MAG: hypothetical protein WBB11_04445, partial [Ferruginibacter sp.]
MKKLLFIFSVLTFVFISCKKENISQHPNPVGLYDSMIYLSSDIQIQKDIAYTTRPNFQHLQYTSENTKQTEITQGSLTAKLDIYTPPNANANKKQPLLVMIHG